MHRDHARTRMRLPRSGVAAVALTACALIALSAGCAPSAGRAYSGEEKALMQLQTAGSVWWTGNGSHAVLQAVGADGRPTVEVWEAATRKTRSLQHYRVVDVELQAARIWVVPDSRPVPLGVNADSADPRIVDVAGDGVDSLPSELYAVDLAKGGEPRADVDARWRPWKGGAGFSASVEIDINKGACPSTLRFYKTGGSLNAWSAKVPTDVVSFEPIGWSPSGKYFAAISQADESATVRIADDWTKANAGAAAGAAPGSAPEKPPTWEADLLVFSAADGALAARQKVTAPVLVPNAGANLAAWSADDLLWYFDYATGAPTFTAVGPMGPMDVVPPRFPASAKPASQAWVAGTDGARMVLCRLPVGEKAEGPIDLWRTDSSGAPKSLGAATGTVARYSPKGGMISLQPYSEMDMGWVVHFAKTPGAAQSVGFAVGGPQDPVRAE